MSDLLKRIADYFANDYQGDDETAQTMEITVTDLRYIANMNVERCRAEEELSNIKYKKCKDCAGCVQCKADEENVIQEYIDKVVQELEEKTDFLKNCTKYGNKNAEQQAESYSTMMMYEVADLVDDLIEIVKQGGVDDDVCEWHKVKNGNAYKCNTHAEIHDSRVLDWCKCPYCGKKIKVVD